MGFIGGEYGCGGGEKEGTENHVQHTMEVVFEGTSKLEVINVGSSYVLHILRE